MPFVITQQNKAHDVSLECSTKQCSAVCALVRIVANKLLAQPVHQYNATIIRRDLASALTPPLDCLFQLFFRPRRFFLFRVTLFDEINEGGRKN